MAVGVTVFWRKWKATDTMRGWNGIPKFQTSKPRKFKEKNQWGSGSVVDVVYLLIYGWYGWVFGCHGAYGNKTSTIYVYIYIYVCVIYIYALCQIAVLLGSVYVTFSCLNELASVFGRFNFWATLEKLRTYLSFLYHTQAGRKIHSWNMNHPGSIHPMYRQFIILFANFDLTASFLLVIAGCLYQSSLFLLFFKSTYTLTWM